MKAVAVTQLGGPETLQTIELPKPKPARSEVLIKVAGAGLNPLDFKIFTGAYPISNLPMPYVPAMDVSGEIVELGADVKDFSVGDKVYGLGNHTLAEFALAQADQVCLAPASLDLPTASALPVAALTAYQALFDYGKLQAGQRVLIQAAGGGVGSFAVQLAKWAGAEVIGTGGPENEHFVRELGADRYINYKTEEFDKVLDSVDLVFDALGSNTVKRSKAILKPGGKIVAIAAFDLDPADFKKDGFELIQFQMVPKPGQLQKISDLVEDLKLNVVIAGQSHFNTIAEAYQQLMHGHVRGKLIFLPQ